MSSVATDVEPVRVLSRPEHPISRSNISGGALKVLYRLHKSGHVAYLVGGGVRDLMLGRRPKDFDIVTDARPSQLRRLFRNCRIIGRRFRLAHVVFADETVEVSTFRALPGAPEERTAEDVPGPEDERDEGPSYGTPAEDAQRRDFTVNALFYDISDFSVIDYVGGLDDLEARRLRVIGDPELRFAEDPVRMLRAVEYAARLDFTIDRATVRALSSCREKIAGAAPARMSYELFEGLRSGASEGIFRGLRRHGILTLVHPAASEGGDELWAVLRALDRRIADGARLSDPVLLGALYLPVFDQVLAKVASGDGFDNRELLARISEILDPDELHLHLPNHVVHLVHQALFALSKMVRPPRRGRQVVKLARQEYFRVAWPLYELWVDSGLGPAEPFEQWSSAVRAVREDDQRRRDERPEGASDGGGRRRSRRRRRGGRRRGRGRSRGSR